ncbi:unnamed protein product [Cuscuta campestris]|uniref:Uncharacterized protein n=1 Tax=Cuscuta campestris TaxID=132261 RepID=A0A484JYP3_9ASTE|nr:unnamed protein product [Cuscuta campestris]
MQIHNYAFTTRGVEHIPDEIQVLTHMMEMKMQLDFGLEQCFIPHQQINLRSSPSYIQESHRKSSLREMILDI